jgi:hypothetical protein
MCANTFKKHIFKILNIKLKPAILAIRPIAEKACGRDRLILEYRQLGANNKIMEHIVPLLLNGLGTQCPVTTHLHPLRPNPARSIGP